MGVISAPSLGALVYQPTKLKIGSTEKNIFPRDFIGTEVRHSTWGGFPQPPCQVRQVVVWLEEGRLRRKCRRCRRCALVLVVVVRLVVDVNDRLALQDAEDDIEALELGGQHDDLAKVEVGGEVLPGQLSRVWSIFAECLIFT